jgi:hypothetical protein
MVGALYLIGLLALTTFVIILERWIYGLFYDEGPWLPGIGPDSDGAHHGGGFGDDTNHNGHGGDSGGAGE